MLHLRSVEYARRYHIPVRVRSSFSQLPGTLVTGTMEDLPMEQAIITGVAHDRSEAKITVVAVPDKPGQAARIFRAVAEAEINIDMIVQNVSVAATARTDISFTLPKADGPAGMAALQKVQAEVGFDSLLYDDHVGKVSLIGAGMRSHPGVSARFFGALADAGVNVELISTSEIRISVLVRDTDLDLAVQAVHDAFELGGTDAGHRVRGDRPMSGRRRPWLSSAHRRRRDGDARDPDRAPVPVGRDPAGRVGPLGRADAAGARRGRDRAGARARGLRRRRRGHVRRAGRGVGASGRRSRPPAARSWWTTPARSGWTRTCRWWCRRSTPTRPRSGRRGSSPTRTARR